VAGFFRTDHGASEGALLPTASSMHPEGARPLLSKAHRRFTCDILASLVDKSGIAFHDLSESVLVHGRTAENAEKAANEFVRMSLCERVEPVFLDLSVMSEVVSLARQVKDRTRALDVLINNAGVYHLASDGFEITMAVNHFAHFVLTRELLGL
jgi:hypothetical protein